MARRYKPKTGAMIARTPRRGEVWLAVDRDKDHNGKESERKYDNSVQGGTRTCIVVSNNKGNTHSPNVEVVYTTTAKKNALPTHFITNTTPVESTVLCEEVMTVSKKDLTVFYGVLSREETTQLNKCLKISLGLD